uniref:Ig-like domain-containing protein n=1 Tax=Vombatus ursinus TaxID=29139 RepID=A0A4X2L488_VOMUR
MHTILGLYFSGCFSDEAVWGHQHVRYEENSLATITCHYASGWEDYVKWWCRGAVWSSCEILVKTTKRVSTNGRVSIQDDTTARRFTVTIRNIRKEDEGAYWCGIEKAAVDRGFQIEVTVFPGTRLLVMCLRPCLNSGPPDSRASTLCTAPPSCPVV